MEVKPPDFGSISASKQAAKEIPEVSIDPDTTAIREALEAGEHLNFSHLGERGTCIRIK